jgi:hypothetical protein
MYMIGDLAQTTDGKWITRPPGRCPNGHPLGANQVLVGHVACLGHGGGGHTSWHCRTCDAVASRHLSAALQGAQTSRGVFVTTGKFSSGALQFAENVAMRIRLIDGKEQTRLMVRYNIGVQVRETFELKRIDEETFEEQRKTTVVEVDHRSTRPPLTDSGGPHFQQSWSASLGDPRYGVEVPQMICALG